MSEILTENKYLVAGGVLIIISIICFVSIGSIYGSMSFSGGIQNALMPIFAILGFVFLILAIICILFHFQQKKKE